MLAWTSDAAACASIWNRWEISPIAGQFRPEENLHGHAAFQPGLVGQVDVGHRPTAQSAEKLEIAQLPAGEISMEAGGNSEGGTERGEGEGHSG